MRESDFLSLKMHMFTKLGKIGIGHADSFTCVIVYMCGRMAM